LPVRRAIIMLICGKADVVHDDPTGPVVHSTSRSIAVPSVIRLKTFVRVPYRARVPMTRAALMHRDRFCCAYCGPRGAAQPRRRSLVGELRRLLLDLQPPQGRQVASRAGLVAALGADVAQGSALAAAVDGQRARPVMGPIPRRRRGLTAGGPLTMRDRARKSTLSPWLQATGNQSPMKWANSM
jgi:hypothetical protein